MHIHQIDIQRDVCMRTQAHLYMLLQACKVTHKHAHMPISPNPIAKGLPSMCLCNVKMLNRSLVLLSTHAV